MTDAYIILHNAKQQGKKTLSDLAGNRTNAEIKDLLAAHAQAVN